MLILNRHNSYVIIHFRRLYTQHRIKILYLPVYTIYFLQLLDVGVFKQLKEDYTRMLRRRTSSSRISISIDIFIEIYIEIRPLVYNVPRIRGAFVAYRIFGYYLPLEIYDLLLQANIYGKPIFNQLNLTYPIAPEEDTQSTTLDLYETDPAFILEAIGQPIESSSPSEQHNSEAIFYRSQSPKSLTFSLFTSIRSNTSQGIGISIDLGLLLSPSTQFILYNIEDIRKIRVRTEDLRRTPSKR